MKVYIIVTRKEKINRYVKPFKEKENSEEELSIQSTNSYTENIIIINEKELKKEIKSREMSRSVYENKKRFNKGKQVEQDQTKILVKAHSGSHQFALSYVNTQEEIEHTQYQKVLRKPAEMKKTRENEIEIQEITIKENTGNELQAEKESNDLYYNDKGNDILVVNQTETLAKALSGFQLIVLSNNQDHQIRKII
jgi:hypothetical protein